MPKVSPEHLAGRRRQILDAALACFAEKGFHVTSMQDVFARSGLSPGAVYRYFRGKDEIIAAIVDETFPHIHAVLEEAGRREPPPRVEDVIDDVLTTVRKMDDIDRRMRTGIQAWGEALHNPAVGSLLTGFVAQARASLTTVVRRAQAHGQIDPALDPPVAAGALATVIPGFMLQCSLFPDHDRAALQEAVVAMVGGRLRVRP